MDNNSEELNQLIEDAKLFLGEKIKFLSDNNTINTNHQQDITDLELRIEALQKDKQDLKQLYDFNPNMLVNFRKRASDIKNEIELIK
jgi:hypothetical protein